MCCKEVIFVLKCLARFLIEPVVSAESHIFVFGTSAGISLRGTQRDAGNTPMHILHMKFQPVNLQTCIDASILFSINNPIQP